VFPCFLFIEFPFCRGALKKAGAFLRKASGADELQAVDYQWCTQKELNFQPSDP